MARSLVLPYLKDPAGLPSAPAARPIFDPRPHRNRGMPGIAKEIKGVPDSLLIATLVAHGQPRFAAEQVRHHPVIRFLAARFWCWVQDAAEGDREAQEKVDYHRWCWSTQRRDGWISDDPEHTIGFAER